MKMNKEIKIRKLTNAEGGGYLAEYIHLKGCIADGETKIEALQELEKAKESWLLSAKEFGMEEYDLSTMKSRANPYINRRC